MWNVNVAFGEATFTRDEPTHSSPLSRPLLCNHQHFARSSVAPSFAPSLPSTVSRAAAVEPLVADNVPYKETRAKKFTPEEWESYARGYASLYQEYDFPVTADMVDGTIPAELNGTYLRNGPGLFEVGGTKVPQPFDGDGMVTALSFKDGKAYFRNRYVRTDAFVEEQQAGKMLYQGVFNKNGPDGNLFNNPLDLKVKKVANTGVIHWAGKLLALYEADLPYQLTSDLKTVGRTALGGAVPPEYPLVGAHYRVQLQPDGSRRWLAFGTNQHPANGKMVLMEFAEDGKLISRKTATFPGGALGLYHDFAITEKHYVVVENPIRLDVGQLLLGYVFKQCSFASCLKYMKDLPSKMHLIPRQPGLDSVQTFELPSFFAFHHLNAFESDDGRYVVLDTCAAPEGVDLSVDAETASAQFFEDPVGRATLMRYVVDRITGKVDSKRLVLGGFEFACVHPSKVGRKQSVAFAGGDDFDHPAYYSPPKVLRKVTLHGDGLMPEGVSEEVFNPGPGRFLGEPVCVPKAGCSGEDDVWLVAYVLDTNRMRSECVVIDGRDVAAGPVATIRLPMAIPHALHGFWSRTNLGPDDAEWDVSAKYDIRQGVAFPDGTFKYA